MVLFHLNQFCHTVDGAFPIFIHDSKWVLQGLLSEISFIFEIQWKGSQIHQNVFLKISYAVIYVRECIERKITAKSFLCRWKKSCAIWNSILEKWPKNYRILFNFHRVPLAASASLCNQNRHCHQCRHFQTDIQTSQSKQKMGPELELLHSRRNFIDFVYLIFLLLWHLYWQECIEELVMEIIIYK